jgi:translation initiation factor IF-2
MAKIKVFSKTKEISMSMEGLSDRMDHLKSNMDEYFRLLTEAKAKAERKARELEEKRKAELAAEQSRKEEQARQEAERLEKERQDRLQPQQEQAPQVVETAAGVPSKSKDTSDETAKAVDHPQRSQRISKAQDPAVQDKSKQAASVKSVKPDRQTQTGIVSDKPRADSRSAGRPIKPDETRDKKPYGDNRVQKGHRKGDIVDKFLSQPVIVPDKGKADSGKGSGGRFVDQNKDKSRKYKKDYWEENAKFNELRKSRKPKKGKAVKQMTPAPERKKAITMGDIITVKELSEKIGIQVAEIIKKLLSLGILATINQELDYDTANLIAAEFNIELERKATKTFEEQLEDIDTEDSEEDLIGRPPVVTVMGHVDHGKTSLLDAIRNANVTDAEAGGITQHIGAYSVNIRNKKISFLDTPGHEAFTSMRARGAQVTDIAILVVAADDGIMPQTVEAINHAKAANVPVIVAINKMDKPEANPDRVKQELTEHGLVVEEWGGETIAVPVSALKREGISELLEMILLVAEMQDLKANPNRHAKGTIIEAQLDKGRGPVATILVQNGTLKIGDSIVAGITFGRVRAMVDDKGRRIKEAGPSTPVEVLGLNDVPAAGDIMYAVEDDKLAKQVSEERKDNEKAKQVKVTSRTSLDELFSQLKEGEVKDLNLIIKADVQGSVEAVRQALEKLSNEQVRVRSIHGGVGGITESDVMLASASNAIIIGFNVRPSANAIELAEREEIDIRTYRVIYNAIEDIEAAMKGMLDPEFKETVIGHASVRATFKVSNIGTIAGSYVTDGKITRNAGVRIVRNGIVIHEGKIDSLKRFKDDVREVASNYECGIGLENFNDIKEGDIIEAFVIEEIKR